MSGRIERAVRGALCVVLVFVAWRACGPHKRSDVERIDTSRGAPAAAPATDAPPPPPPREPLPPATPRPSRGFMQLHADADAGDVGAQIDLGALLAKCLVQGEPQYAERIAEIYDNALRSDFEFANFTAEQRAAFLERQRRERDLLLREHADCVLMAEAGFAPSHTWLERAARSGDIEAKVAYAAMALDEFIRTGDGLNGATERYVDNLEEIVRRRDLARRWLGDALHAGSTDALKLLARAYAGEHPLYPHDARLAAIHRHALALADARRSGDSARLRSVWNAGPQRFLQDRSDPADREAIDAEAQRIYLRWFGPAPGEG